MKYQGIVCASVLLERPLAGFYVTNILDDGMPFTGVIEMSALVDRDQFGGRSLIYLPRYLTEEDPFYETSDEAIREEFLSTLESMYPGFRGDQVVAFRVSRVRQVLALSTLNYSDALPSHADVGSRAVSRELRTHRQRHFERQRDDPACRACRRNAHGIALERSA